MEKVDDDQSFDPRPSKIIKIDQMDHVNIDLEEFDENQKTPQDRKVVDGHDNDSFTLKPIGLAKIKEFDDKNPFQVTVILDVLFKMLSFEEVKNFRLVSSTWNELGFSELNRRPQKPIKFNRIEELENDDIFGQIVQLQRRHNEVFSWDHQIFSNFSFNVQLLASPQIDIFLAHFLPKFVQFFGNSILSPEDLQGRQVEVEIGSDAQILTFFSKFLIKISPTVQAIQYDDLYLYFDPKQSFEPDEELVSTKFTNLRKIFINMDHYNKDMKKMFVYPIIGQNSPKLNHLKIGSVSRIGLGPVEEMKEMLGPTDLIQKLRILELNHADKDLLNGLAEFSQNGLLKLTKLKFVNENIEDQPNEIFVRLIETQAESLKVLEISTTFSYTQNRVSFPQLPNLTILQIDNFSNFETFYKPINFSVQFPKLLEFRTNQIVRFLYNNLGQGGDSVKSVILYNRKIPHLDNCKADQFPHPMDFVKFRQIFPNLKYLELNANLLPPNDSAELGNLPYWSKLTKVVIHSRFNNDLAYFNLAILKAIKKCEIVVNCEEIEIYMMNEDFYKDYLGFIIMEDSDDNSGHYNRDKFYKKYLATVSNHLKSIQTASFTIIGYKISEDFKRDWRKIFPQTVFICSPFKSPPYDY